MQESDSHPRVLLVEGPDDKHVVIHLSERSGLTQNFVIVEKEGINSLLDSIEVEVDIPGRTVLGIIGRKRRFGRPLASADRQAEQAAARRPLRPARTANST